VQHHIQRLYQRQQLRRERTAERPDSVAIGPDGVLDLVRLGLASLRETARRYSGTPAGYCWHPWLLYVGSRLSSGAVAWRNANRTALGRRYLIRIVSTL
jgi:hypothetical protein